MQSGRQKHKVWLKRECHRAQPISFRRHQLTLETSVTFYVTSFLLVCIRFRKPSAHNETPWHTMWQVMVVSVIRNNSMLICLPIYPPPLIYRNQIISHKINCQSHEHATILLLRTRSFSITAPSHIRDHRAQKALYCVCDWFEVLQLCACMQV